MANKGFGVDNDHFLDEFIPSPPDSSLKPVVKRNPFSKLKDAAKMKESRISELFVEAINKYKLAPGMELALSERKPDPKDIDRHGQKVDAAFFLDDECPSDERPNWADQVVPVEFKSHKAENDPFDDRGGITTEASSDPRTRVRAQIISYAELVFAVQQRTALFMFLIIGRKFRLTRWDRSGTMVTRAVDYYTEWKLFCDILWRISQLSRPQLGFDPTATRICSGEDDFEKMDDAAKEALGGVDHNERDLAEDEVDNELPFTYVRTMFRDSLTPTWPRYRLEVPDGKSTRKFLVGKPVFCAKGMAGRGTRGYVALECGTSRFVWLKDAWRAHYLLVDKEGDVLAQLNAAEVFNVPKLVCHGDIAGQATVSPEWWEWRCPLNSTIPVPVPPFHQSSKQIAGPSSSKSLKRKREDDQAEGGRDGDGESSSQTDCPLRRHQHYRIVVEEVAMPLTEFQSGYQLVSIILDCIIAHNLAVEQAGIIHRDVSGGNILIYPKVVSDRDRTSMSWTGLLTDWELSKPVDDKGSLRQVRQPERTGTWQFMSVALLSNMSKVVTISDELEAFFHILHYYAVRYLRSNCVDVGNYIEDFFDSFTLVDGVYKAGQSKASMMKASTNHSGSLSIDITSVAPTPLRFGGPMDGLLSTILQWFTSFYCVEADREMQKEKSKLEASVKDLPLPPSSPSPLAVAQRPGRAFLSRYTDDDPSVDEIRPSNRPSPMDERRAKKVNKHDPMIVLFGKALALPSWRSDDKLGDRVPDNWVPKRPMGTTARSTIVTNTSKKAKVSGGPTFTTDPVPPGAASGSAKATKVPKTPRKTRTSTRRGRSAAGGRGKKAA